MISTTTAPDEEFDSILILNTNIQYGNVPLLYTIGGELKIDGETAGGYTASIAL